MQSNFLFTSFAQEHLTRTFVMHYSRIPSVLEMSKDPDTLSNRVVHMSVQLFSNESLALKMVEELSLLHVMIISLKLMMTKNLIQNTLHGNTERTKQSYWQFFVFTNKYFFYQILQRTSTMLLIVPNE